MLVSDFGVLEKPLRCDNEARRYLLTLIVADFRKAFPQIQYELRLQFGMINAQAVMFGYERGVLMYGGLALHPELGEDSLTLALLHETGHHLASGRRLPFSSFLACECISDNWAVTAGAHVLRERSSRGFIVTQAVSELDGVMGYGQGLHKCYSPNMQGNCCWHRIWRMRKRALVRASEPPHAGRCWE